MKNEGLENWDGWDKLNGGTVQFILNQSEKKLEQTIETAKILTERTIRIMQFVIALTIGILGYLSTTEFRGLLFQLSIILLVVSAVIFWYCLNGYNLYTIQPLGNSPSNMLASPELIADEDQEQSFICSSLINIDKAINSNDTINNNRAENLNTIFGLIRIGFWAVVAYSAIFSLFHL